MFEDVHIRLAEISDIDSIIRFLEEHWIIPNHVFTRRRDLFENCHLIDGRVTFLLAVGKETGSLYGLLGYSYNNCNFENPDISAVIFQTLKTSNPSLGIDMILELQRVTNCRSLFCPGILKKTRGLYRFLGYETGKLAHYYRLGDVSEYKIASIQEPPLASNYADHMPQFSLGQLDSMQSICAVFEFERFQDTLPYRDAWSVEQRYFKNIGYEYMIFGIFEEEGICKALLVGREIACNGAKMMKIIDYIGSDEALAHCSRALGNLISDNRYEYIDFYELGIEDEYMEAAGFSLLSDESGNVIPNYFEPYERVNSDIWYFTTVPGGAFHIYRTDAGQDRPNFIDEIQEG